MGVAVVTASLPERHQLLADAVQSVRIQTHQPVEHVVVVDYARKGTASALNRALRAVSSPWVAVLDDDDVLYPHHLATLRDASDGADVVYSYCDMDRTIEGVNRPFDEAALRWGNYIPATVLIRTTKLLEVGGWPHEKLQDWHLYLRLLDIGARFVCVPEVTWRYRFHDLPQKTFTPELK